MKKTKEKQKIEWKSQCIIFDIDGTLAHDGIDPSTGTYRGLYEFDKAMYDTVDEAMLSIYNRLIGIAIILTGRPQNNYKITRKWLDNNGIFTSHLVMKPDNDKRPSYFFKEEYYLKNIKPRYDVLYAIDDDEEVVKMWQRNGIKVLQIK